MLDTDSGSPKERPMPSPWVLTEGIELAHWQREACDAWFAAGRRGTMKVVTGAGKTILALAIAERLQKEDPSLRVAIVVPTIVLMNQWFDTLCDRSNLPESALARVGGGYSDGFDETKRIMVAVLASARTELPKAVNSGNIGDHLLLIVDECHRAGAPEMSAVLSTHRRYSLGLSATPQRADAAEKGVADYDSSPLGESIGPIVYEMTFAEANRLKVLPPFELHHLGLPLSPTEASHYQALSRSISDARRELKASSREARRLDGEQLLAWARRVSSRGKSDIAGLAGQFVNDTSRRKQLLYRAESRTTATRLLIKEALESGSDARIILFHESIDEVQALFGHLLRENNYPVVMEHSKLPQSLRDESLELFRQGIAQVVVSARSLIEGFNVPEADLGIIVASSSSPRQRIQSIGRVLRTHRGSAGEEKTSRVCVLYIRDSVDEQIYEKEDWGKLVGPGRNRYFHWDPPEARVELPEPPRTVVPTEDDIDMDTLNVGDVYPGRYEGDEFSTDSQGNVTNDKEQVAADSQNIPDVVVRLKDSHGRFRITPKKRAILVRVPTTGDSWATLYGGVLKKPLKFSTRRVAPRNFDVANLGPGASYPGPVEPAEESYFRQKRGGIITKRVPGGEVYARGSNADKVVATIRELRREQLTISKIYTNRLNHVFWFERGVPRFIAALDGLLWPPAEAQRD